MRSLAWFSHVLCKRGGVCLCVCVLRAQLVLSASIAGASKVILQMPRGNLEAVAPRVLVLATIADHLLVRLRALWRTDI